MTSARLRSAVRRPAARPRVEARRSGRWTSPAPSRTCAKRSCCGWRGPRTGETGLPTSVSRVASPSTASATAGSFGTGRSRRLWIQPAAGDAGGALGVAQLDLAPPLPDSRGTVGPGATRCREPISVPSSRPRKSGRSSTRTGAPYQRLEPDDARRARRRAPGRREGRRMVRRAHGVRPARARRAQHPRRSSEPERCRRR